MRERPVNLQVDKPQKSFDAPVKLDTPAAKLSLKYPELDRILSSDVNISSRQLGELLNVSHETANQARKEWLEIHKPKEERSEKRTSSKVLSAAEAEEMKETLPAAYADYFDYLDQYLISLQKNTNPTEIPQEVWSNVTDEEIDKLSRTLIRAGKHNAGAAMIARGLVEGRDYLVTGAIVAPRAIMTFQIVKASRGAPSSRKREA